MAQLSKDIVGLAGIFAVSGTVHLVKPDIYEPLMPSWVPAHREVILGSGVAELLCAAGLLVPGTRKTAGLASAALLLGVWVGNIKMADDARRSPKATPAWKAATYARLPMQIPMIRTAMKATRA